MRLYHHFHQNLNHYFHTQLSKLELSVWLHTVGRSLIAIFIPILLLMSGFQLNQVILFLFLFYSMDVPLNFLARKSTLKIGARNTIIIGVVFEIISFVVLYFVAYSWKMLIAFAFTWAMYDTFYWVAHWFIFNECVKVKKGVGKQVGFLFIIRRLGSVASPAIGAIFLIFFAKEYLILVSILFVIISLIPLFSIKLDFMQPKIKQSFKQFFKDKKNKINFAYLSLMTISSTVEATILPLFIFVTFSSIKTIGILPMIATFSSILFTYYIGKFADRYDKTKLILVGAMTLALIWIIRIMFPEIPVFYVSTIFMGFLASLIDIPIDSKLIENGKKTSMLDTSTYRNSIIMFVGAIFYGTLYFLMNIFHISFVMASFSMFALSIFCTFILLNEKNKSVRK